MRKSLFIVLSLVLTLSFVTGCGKDTPAREVLIHSIDKSKEINSYSVEGNMKIAFNFDDVNATSDELAMLQMIPEINIEYSGNQIVNPMQAEVMLKTKINLQGMDVNIELPIIIKDNVLYIKIPGAYKTQLQMVFPEFDASKEYLAVEMAEALENYDEEQARLQSIEVLKTLLGSIEDSYLTKEDSKAYTITDGKSSDVVTITITQENVKPVLKSLMKEGLPLLIEQMEQYSVDADQKQQLDEFKNELVDSTEEIDSTIEELDKYLTINNFKITNVFDKDGFNRKTLFNTDLKIVDEELGSFGIIISIEQNTNNINKEIKFEMPIPTQEQVITTDELDAMFYTY